MNKEYVYIGKIVNTHGIKGELRILSNFEKKERVFLTKMNLWIGKEKQKETINTYRKHKEFDMVTLEGYTNINEVLKWKGQPVYVKREELHLKEDEYLLNDLIGLEIYEKEEKIGKGKEIVYNKANILLYVEAEKNFYIPIKGNFIKKVDKKQNKIEVENVKGLIV